MLLKVFQTQVNNSLKTTLKSRQQYTHPCQHLRQTTHVHTVQQGPGLSSVQWVSHISVTVSRAAQVSQWIFLPFCAVATSLVERLVTGVYCSTSWQGCSYIKGPDVIWTQLVFRSAGPVYFHLWSVTATVLSRGKKVILNKLSTSKSVSHLNWHMVSFLHTSPATVRLRWIMADVLLCPVRLMYIPSKKITVCVEPARHLHHHFLFLSLGACLLNPASGKWSALYSQGRRYKCELALKRWWLRMKINSLSQQVHV